MLRLIFSLAMSSLAAAEPLDKGYVVRVDSDTVWLDLNAADGAAAGAAFEIYAEGDELKHPVTGASLGRARASIAEGSVKEVSDRFSVGSVSARKGEVKTGQRARLMPAAAAAPGAAPGSRAPKTRGAALDFAVNAMAVGDFDKIGGPQIALASENTVKLYAYPALNAKPLAEITLAGTGLKILGLEAADLDGDGRDELFVSLYDDAFKRFETRVLKVEGGKWLKAAELPFLTHAHQDAAGTRTLATQQVLDDKSFPFGGIYPLAYQDGRYVQARPALKLGRADWLFGFTTAQLSRAEPSVLLLTSTHALRVQTGDEHWRTSDDDYGQTPVRVRWQDRLLEFNPPLPTISGPAGFEAVFAARNMAALGGLAAPFGVFNRAEVARLRWNGLGLEADWKAELPGCVLGLAVADVAAGRRELVVALRGSAGQSSVWTFEP